MRRALPILLFVTVGVVFLALSHGYLALRLVVEPGLAGAARALGLGALALGVASILLQPVAERTLRSPWARAVSWPASIWMGLGFVLLHLLLVSDALLWGAGRLGFDTESVAVARARAAAVAGLGLVVCGVALRNAFLPPRGVRLEVEIERWPVGLDGFRIVQVSDLHVGPILGRAFAAETVARANALDADLVAVTGDLVDGSARLLAPEVAPFADLRARHGVFFVTGNHDHFSGAGAWCETIRDLGIRVLRNEHIAVETGAGGFDLVGVDDHHAQLIGGGAEDLDAALAGRDAERPAVLLAHDPGTFKTARRRAIDLQLSGHTHGGQIWPFGGYVRLAVPWVAGLHRDGRAQLYVSRGTGFWGPPMRLGAPAEITEIVLRAPAERAGRVA